MKSYPPPLRSFADETYTVEITAEELHVLVQFFMYPLGGMADQHAHGLAPELPSNFTEFWYKFSAFLEKIYAAREKQHPVPVRTPEEREAAKTELRARIQAIVAKKKQEGK